MRDFWDRRAEEDAFYFVDNRLSYRAPDLDAFWEGGRKDVETILRDLELEIEPGDDVVEIGCGVGRLTRVLAGRGKSVRAVDVSSRMLDLAQAHNGELRNVTWVLGDGSTLTGIKDRSADVCFSHVVFQHIPDPATTLGYVREMGRVLRAGGWSAFQISNQPTIHRPQPRHKRLAALPARIMGRAPRGQAHEAWLGSAVALSDLRDAARAGGTRVERVIGEGTQYCLVLLRKEGSEQA